MKILKKLWDSFNGKKTVLASIYWGTVMPGLAIYFPDGIPSNINRPVIVLGFFLTSVGLGHKWYKKRSDQEQE